MVGPHSQNDDINHWSNCLRMIHLNVLNKMFHIFSFFFIQNHVDHFLQNHHAGDDVFFLIVRRNCFFFSFTSIFVIMDKTVDGVLDPSH